MRKHSVRKWLHAILDLLPVIILPIFAIYSHRHTIDSYEVTVPQNEVVNFNQQWNKPSNWSRDFSMDGVNRYYGDIDIYYEQHYYYISYNFSNVQNALVTDYFSFNIGNDVNVIYSNDFTNGFHSFKVFCPQDGQVTYIYLNSDDNVDISLTLSYVNVIDLTEMFGSGNEPTLEQFNAWYPNDYYEYNEGTKQLLKGVSTVTYYNTDIGSQMIYSLYKPINDYFNLNNVFNFGAIYDWFELNMFNGNAPLSIFIVWNIIVYEFIMDIIFLIYSVFMFVIDFACETLDRFTGWAKRGD